MSNSPHRPPAMCKSPLELPSDQPPPQLPPIQPRPASSQTSLSQSSASPTPPREPRPLRSKRSPVLAACNTCRKKKSRCDAKRPTCGPCFQAKLDCVYAIPEGLTAREAQKRKLDEISVISDDYQSVVRLLRHGSEDDAQAAFRRLRESGSVEATVRSLADASLLLLPATGPSAWPGSTPEQQDSPAAALMMVDGENPPPPIESPFPLSESAPPSFVSSPFKGRATISSPLPQDPGPDADV